YSSRHWYATGKLVLSKVNTGAYDLKEVCDDMHHSSTKVTERYTRTANKWYKIAPYDWFNTLLKLTKKRAIKKCKISTTTQNRCTDRNPSEKEVWARPGRNLLTDWKKTVNIVCKHVLKKHSTLLFLFSFFEQKRPHGNMMSLRTLFFSQDFASLPFNRFSLNSSAFLQNEEVAM
ncbi:MAG TPA: hypothetical protein VKP59_01415, partial [Candidatus Thermoplasmatota archaeon]|nr:hypothetical protein [Candidatus Thermoplasmatota archaeon]